MNGSFPVTEMGKNRVGRSEKYFILLENFIFQVGLFIQGRSGYWKRTIYFVWPIMCFHWRVGKHTKEQYTLQTYNIIIAW